MKNHEEKLRDLARSVLPSTKRRSSRLNKQAIKQRNRAATRRTLRRWSYEINAYDCEEFTYDYIYGWGETQNIKMNVRDRREGDKLSIVHWAERVSETRLASKTDEEKYHYFKRVLPDNLIGRHALGHIKTAVLPMYDREYLFRSPFFVDGRWMTNAERRELARTSREAERSARMNKLYSIMETPGAHARFNLKLKQTHTRVHHRWSGWGKGRVYEPYTCPYCTDRPRCFEGIGDIDSWLDYAESARQHLYLQVLDRWEIG